MYNSLQKAPSTQYAESELGTERMPSVAPPEASFACSVAAEKRLARPCGRRHNQQGAAGAEPSYAVQVLEAVYEDETNEVRDWLASTFTRSQTSLKQNKEKPHFRSVANAIRAGINGGEPNFCHDRIYRRLSSSSSISVPPNVLLLL
uniref:PDEase_I_N domain-containing protein n=1 Tax=Macrostomum lignano TaxID=282301 RepID=A0A1I8FNL7_9PLAT